MLSRYAPSLERPFQAGSSTLDSYHESDGKSSTQVATPSHRQSQRKKMTNQVVLITGALTGIGRATAVAFAKKGAKVVVSGRHDDKGQELATELRALGVEAEFVRADVQNEDEVRDLVDKTVARFGRLDVAVNNAGVEGETGVIQDTTVENFRNILNTNVLGVFLSMKYELRAMEGQ